MLVNRLHKPELYSSIGVFDMIDGVPGIVRLHDLCHNFPERPENEILRDSFIASIENLFSQAAFDAVTIDAQAGVGTTTLLAQFARIIPILLFVYL